MKKSVYFITLLFLLVLAGASFGGETEGSKSKKLDKKSILFPTIPPKVEPVKPENEAFQIEEKKVEYERKKTEKELREEKREKRLEEKRAKEEEKKKDKAEGRFGN